ncbi:MAG: hypothetical protein ACJASX_004114 [Limisphaerales bacterium]|jgi:hypothetical protein
MGHLETATSISTLNRQGGSRDCLTGFKQRVRGSEYQRPVGLQMIGKLREIHPTDSADILPTNRSKTVSAG